MDTFRDLPQIGQENPRVPTSPDVDDALFYSVFDWEAYCDSTQSADKASPYPGRSTPRALSKLITEIPSLISDYSLDYSLESLGHEFLKMNTSFSPDDEVATTSSYSGQTPPELVRGGSTSPSDHSGSIILERAEEARRRPDVSLREVQAQDDEWTYPQTDPRKPAPRGYPPRLQVQEDPSRGANLKRRRSGHNLDKRQRQLSDPVQTADVRKSGACLPCRVSKTRCHESGVCPTCRKAFPDHSHLVCTRITPAMAWPVIGTLADVWSVNPTEEEQFRLDPRFFTGKQRDIAVYFSRDVNSSTLRATVQAYRSQDGTEENPRKAAFPREKVPSYHELQKWVESQIQRENSSDFKSLLQNFLFAYSEEGKGLPKHDLVTKVHKMNCFFRIWRTHSFWCRDPSNKLVSLPLSVQAELRLIAREALKSLEHDVLKHLDDCLAQQGPVKTQEKMAIWASMWQLILIYRDLLTAFKGYISRLQGTVPDSTISKMRAQYQGLSEKFFPLMAVFYHYQFRTKKSLELSLDWLKSPYPSKACQSKRIRNFAKDLIDSRKKFYETVQKSKNDIDGMLCVFVVNHELKKLNTRRRSSKSSSRAKGGDDDCDEDAD
ncbi:Fc.00g064440.m01.CDS01 [Cosmosporella sp. VM-42]